MSQHNGGDRPAQESDPRFPSGEWTGHYTQWGRKYKMTVVLTFRLGRFDGLGIDTVGMFDVNGTYDVGTGKVSFLKRYHGQHGVDYSGYVEVINQGMWGTWSIGKVMDQGGWQIWPRRFGGAQNRSEYEENPVPEASLSLFSSAA